jgi:hypothetical protein
MHPFPSRAWFGELARVMNENVKTFERIGPADVTWGVAIMPSKPDRKLRMYRIAFAGIGCSAVDEVDPQDPGEIAFVLEARLDTWREMIVNIQSNGSADLHHTLNYLALPDDPINIRASDVLDRDLFARFGHTFQKFFDGAAQVPTQFDDEG